jgi:hypothetical protein
MIRVREETAVPSFKNKDSITEYTFVCTVATASGYANMATAGCAQAGWNNIPYEDLLELNTNGHE